MSCRNCRFLDVAPDAAGRVVARKGRVYRCVAPEPTMPDVPASVWSAYGWSWPPARRHMSSTDGEGCATFEVRAKGHNDQLKPPRVSAVGLEAPVGREDGEK